MKRAVIIAAAGVGRRMGGNVPKQYLNLLGKPVICHTLERFISPGIDEIIVVVETDRVESFRAEIVEFFGYPSNVRVVAGGDVRQRSVYNGLMATSSDVNVVLVHDGVRPFVSREQIDKISDMAFHKGACILAHPIKETIKRICSDGTIAETVDREGLFGAQTPQAFRRDVIVGAMERAFADGFVGTDEASLFERCGGKVHIVSGDSRNIKITTPSDLTVAEAIAREWK
ncbi:MAG TPA: 2-C-methyl-D-erythritol 4-phosphate cytidylyltransferase [bacterium]|nr:2-C-methyl-D-erythritol 4-phosphate cytidylyltransferase [Myxococcales bacterium]HQC50947.1 2-C-methyl-D-erythritol 4-phosphate cytidylyltransferase [bacterium]